MTFEEVEKLEASAIMRRRAALFLEIDEVRRKYDKVFDEDVAELRKENEMLFTVFLAKTRISL